MQPLLPAKAGLLFVHAAVGCLGGVMAAAHRSDAAPPSLWAVCQRAIVGLGTGAGVGMLGLAKLGDDDAAFFWILLGSLIGGYCGPLWVWQAIRAVRPDLPGPPTDPPPPPHVPPPPTLPKGDIP